MSNSYRGVDTPAGSSGFVGVDEAAFGDGTTTSTPLSTGLLNRLTGNVLYLAPGVATTSFAPIVANWDPNSATGDRPWTSLGWSSIGLWTIPADRGFEGVRLGGVYNVESNSTQNGIQLMVCLSPYNSGRFNLHRNFVTVSNTQNGGNPDYTTLFSTPSDGDFTLNEYVKTPAEYILAVYVRGIPSGDSGVTGESANFAWGACEHATDTGFASGNAFYNQQSANPYDTAAAGVPLETAYLSVTAGMPTNDNAYEIIGQNNQGSTDALLVAPTPSYVPGLTVKLSYLSWIQIRGLWIQPLYRNDSVLQLPQLEIEANKTTTAAPAVKLATAIRELHNRRRLLAVGPQGVLDSTTGFEEYQGRDYPFRWPFVDGDDTVAESGGSATHTNPDTNYLPLIEQCVFVDGENPTIVLDCFFMCVQKNQYSAHSTDSGGATQAWVNGIPTAGPDGEYIGEADWDFELKIHQLTGVASPSDAEWWEAASKTNLISGASGNDGETWVERLAIHPVSEFAESRTVKTIQTVLNFDASSDLAWGNREGSVFMGDESILQRLRFSVVLTNMDTSTATGRPIRVRLEAGLNAIKRYCSTQSATTADVRLMLAGFSIWQENSDG